MASSKGFDRAKFEEAFRIMGRYLLDRHVLGEIAIYGGHAILFQFDWSRTSEDIDARIISSVHHGLIIQAAEQSAMHLGLPCSWLNESVAMYVRRGEEATDRTFIGVYPSPERVGLRVVAAKPEYARTMLAWAIRSAHEPHDAKWPIRLTPPHAYGHQSRNGPANPTIDRGREGYHPSPPSEPYVRFSRIRLSSRRFPHRECLASSQAV